MVERLDRNLNVVEVMDLIDTLQSVHAKGWLCRDVRPANIMLVNKRATLIDWNAAMRLLPSGKSAPTTNFAGTLWFASTVTASSPP